MKAKFLFILLSVLFVIPVGATITKHKNRKSKIRILKFYREVQTRSPLDFNMSVNDGDNVLQILFQSPLPDAEIIVIDKDGNTVIDESQTSIYEGKTLYIYTPDAYPYTIRITSPILDVTGEIIQDDI